MNDTSFCPDCGAQINAHDRFCTECGARQDEFGAADEAERPAPTFPTEAVIRAVPPPNPPGDEDSPPPPAGADESRRYSSTEWAWEHTPAPSFPTEAVIRAVPKPEPPRVDDAPPPPPPPPPHAAKRPFQDASDLTGALKEQLAVPGIVAALTAGAAAAGIVLVAGLLIALVTPDRSLIGIPGVGASIITETFRQAVGTLLAPMVDPGLLLAGGRRIHPMIFLAIPLTALAFMTRRQIHRTEGAPPLTRLTWALAVAVPFSVLMLVFAVIGGETEATSVSVSVGNTFALAILWGLVGGLIGAATTLPLRSVVTVPPLAQTVLAAVRAALIPLVGVLLVCTVLGLFGWLVQVTRNAGEVRVGRGVPTALIEETVFAAEHGVQLTALAAGAKFRADANGALGLPFPVADANDVPSADGTFRIFAYSGELPASVLLPALVLLLSLVALGALYAGFAVARAVQAPTMALAATWGALTGPVWAIAMAGLVVLAGGLFHGDAADGSVFVVFLLGGAILGAAGGALSAQSSTPRSSAAATS